MILISLVQIFFRYLQLRTFLTTHKEWDKFSKPTPLEKYLIELQTGDKEKQIISKLYNILLSMNQNDSSQIRGRWEAEANMDISRDDWHDVCTEAHMVTNSNTWREFKWKIITRYFKTPAIVSKMGPQYPSSCWRNCGAHIANHTLIFWLCPKLSVFWREVFSALNEVFRTSHKTLQWQYRE